MKFFDSIPINTVDICSLCGGYPPDANRVEVLDSNGHILEIYCFVCRYPGWVD